MTRKSLSLILILAGLAVMTGWTSGPASLELALLKYHGGGDWYANPTSLTNLAEFCNQVINTN
ncbi:MAG: hypothetical protein R3330_14050, partial [Saprospiraceae bacterium]|nr:hypothetical protein [Saprospiraceae bacterium]